MRVVLYARVSSSKTNKSENLSIQGQLYEMRSYAEKRKWQIYREFVDHGRSGSSDQRPAFLEMIEEAQSGLFSAVLVWKYSRFSRSQQDSRLYKQLLQEYGVEVISLNEPSEEPNGKLIERVVELIDEHYAKNARQDTQMALNQKKSRVVPVGYRLVDNRLWEIDEDYAAVVRKIFELCIAGEGIGNITKTLNESNIARPDGKKWNSDNIYKILKNQIYATSCYAIISWDIFEKAQACMQQRRITKSASRVYLFNGLLHCGLCGSKMTGQAKTRKHTYYRCYQHSKRNCPQKMIRCDHLDIMVVQQCLSIIEKRFSHRLCEMIQEQIVDAPNALGEQIEVLQKRLNQHYDAFELGQISIEYLKPRIETLFDEIARLQKQRDNIGKLRDCGTLVQGWGDLWKIWEKIPMWERQDWISNFIERVEYRGEDVVVVYRF